MNVEETRLRHLKIRFWKKVNIGSESICWPLKGRIRLDGYGDIKVQGKMLLVHRVAWELTNGPIPNRLYVCHSCDNKQCCNPSHLFLGNQGDNMADAIRKGRTKRLLTDIQIRVIKRLTKLSSLSQIEIAEVFKVSQAIISRVKRGVQPVKVLKRVELPPQI